MAGNSIRSEALEEVAERLAAAKAKYVEAENARDAAHEKLEEAKDALPRDTKSRANRLLGRPESVPRGVVELAETAATADVALEEAKAAVRELEVEHARVRASLPARLRAAVREAEIPEVRALRAALASACDLLDGIAKRTDENNTYLDSIGLKGSGVPDVVHRGLYGIVVEAHSLVKQALADWGIALSEGQEPEKSESQLHREAMRRIDERPPTRTVPVP